MVNTSDSLDVHSKREGLARSVATEALLSETLASVVVSGGGREVSISWTLLFNIPYFIFA